MGIDRMNHGIRLTGQHKCGFDANLSSSQGIGLERYASTRLKYHTSQSLLVTHRSLDKAPCTCDSLFNQSVLDLGEERQ